MSDEAKPSLTRFWITVLGALVPLLALIFTGWKYVDEVSRQNIANEQTRILSAQNRLFDSIDSIGSAGISGPTQIFAVRQLRDSEQYCDTVIRVLSAMYCGLDAGRSPDEYLHLTSDGQDRSNLSIEMTLSLASLCKTCPDHPTTTEICRAREAKSYAERCAY